MGARPRHVFSLLILEASVLTFIGLFVGIVGLYAMLSIAAPIIQQSYGINLQMSALSHYEWILLAAVQLAGTIIGFIPAFRAYRQSLSDGMTIRV